MRDVRYLLIRSRILYCYWIYETSRGCSEQLFDSCFQEYHDPAEKTI